MTTKSNNFPCPALVDLWGSDDFKPKLKHYLESRSENDTLDILPLQQGLAHSNIALAGKISAHILKCEESKGSILCRANIFYYGLISGCNCADDPSPVEPNNEHCEVQITLNKESDFLSTILIP